ncbi:glycoside hydrolase family 3 domain protein [Petrotoga mobilis SJ95]|uniref:beta-N-acetylhexosaminidase n=1 Tax=Petrotoga mobilis (strain DSM 10674 / SJ95) TaxID=403833 RepID=A9BFQ0_PETMO|nr:beta-N-acetylhexosaminidase [Petrotoga mobilis]ABX31220.1 glycoside hydrolase family 3 domain protein [Petrotoga mobilis SJ95]
MESLEKALGKLFLIGIQGTSLNNENMKVLKSTLPGVIIFFSRNIENKYQLSKFIEDIKNFLDYEPLFCIDQEGGTVARLKKGFTVVPSAMGITATNEAENAYLSANLLAKEMLAVGIDWNLAPVVDINNNPKNSVIGIRSFSDDKNVVLKFAREYVKGLHDGGVLSCLKHFPGIGNVNTDPHLDLPQGELSKDDLLSTELFPFLNIDSPSWMPTHVYLSKIQNKKEPASLSEEILTGLAREELKYKGVLVADDFEMGGVANFYSAQEAVIKSLNAGMDIVSICHSFEKQSAAKNAVLREYKNNENFKKKINSSLERIQSLMKISADLREKNNNKISLEEIGKKEYINLAKNIFDKSITVLNMSHDKSFLPLKNVDEIYYFAKESLSYGIEDKRTQISYIIEPISKELKAKVNILETSKIIDPLVREEIIQNSKNKTILVLAENAYLHSELVDLISNMSQKSKKLILVALRNPYDVFIPKVKYGICTYGFNENIQTSLLKILKGEIKPTGNLPIKRRLENARESGNRKK